MAWMMDHWIGRTDRNIATEELMEVLDGLDEINSADVDEDDVEDVASAVDELGRLERINASEEDLIAFAFEYFSEERDPGWEGFDIKDVSDEPIFHREIADIMDEISNDKVSDKMAAAAPDCG